MASLMEEQFVAIHLEKKITGDRKILIDPQ
jgi:hypothetical protein